MSIVCAPTRNDHETRNRKSTGSQTTGFVYPDFIKLCIANLHALPQVTQVESSDTSKHKYWQVLPPGRPLCTWPFGQRSQSHYTCSSFFVPFNLHRERRFWDAFRTVEVS